MGQPANGSSSSTEAGSTSSTGSSTSSTGTGTGTGAHQHEPGTGSASAIRIVDDARAGQLPAGPHRERRRARIDPATHRQIRRSRATWRRSTTRTCSSIAAAGPGCTRSSRCIRPCAGRRSAAAGCGAMRTPAQALRDALRLSRAMTYKAAVADLPLGGGKGVIMTAPGSVLSSEHRTEALLDFADAVESLGGRYITAEDVGTSSRDMKVIAQRTESVAGLPRGQGGSGDPSPYTALGVEAAIRAVLRAGVRVELAQGADGRGGRTRPRRLAGRQALRQGRRKACPERHRRAQAAIRRGARRRLGHPGGGLRARRRRGGAVCARRRSRPRHGAAAALPGRRRRSQQPARGRVGRGAARRRARSCGRRTSSPTPAG